MVEILRRLIELHDQIEKLKECYKEQDELLQYLIDKKFSSTMLDGKILVLIDHYANKNVVWKSTAHRRHELNIAKL